MIYISIDCGIKGCTVLCEGKLESKNIVFHDHVNSKYYACTWSDYVISLLRTLLKDEENLFVIIEQQSYRSFQAGTDTTLINYGKMLGAFEALKIGYEVISPRTWQKYIPNLPKSKEKGHKQAIADYASDMCQGASLYKPSGKLLDGRSDALAMLLIWDKFLRCKK